MRRLACLLLFATYLALPACGPRAVKSLRETAKAPEPAELIEETWEAIYMEKSKVGHTHSRVEKLKSGKARWISQEQTMDILRYGQPTSVSQSFTGKESLAGEVLDFESITKTGSGDMVVRGTNTGNQLTMELKTRGDPQQRTIPWNSSWGGVLASTQSLKDKPLQPGETRELHALWPEPPFPSVCKITLAGLAVETTDLLNGKSDLLKIKQTIELEGGNKIEPLAWVNEQGEVLKTQINLGSITQTNYRVSKAVALAKTSGPKFDLGLATTVKVARPPGNKRTVYRARLPGVEIKKAFVTGATQSVRYIDEQTAEIVVRAITPDEPAQLETPDASPTAADREPNNLIQSDDQRVVTLANAVARNESDPWKLAVALERHIEKSIRSNFSQAFATAAETAESLEGDCTEHAMLLAAVCRARQMPARVAVGLVYDGKQGYAFHMWTEVWITDRWIPLDATRGDGGIGAAHLKLAQSNLQVSSITTALFPVFNVLGRLELEIVEAE